MIYCIIEIRQLSSNHQNSSSLGIGNKKGFFYLSVDVIIVKIIFSPANAGY